VQFGQWTAAIESFRNEYGHYPVFDGSNLVNGGATSSGSSEHRFYDLLAGHHRDGSALDNTGATSAGAQNRKLISFYSFAESDLTDANSASPNLVRDACGNTEIAVLVDRNLDGVINASDYGGVLPIVGGIRPGPEEFPAGGVRAGVVFYSASPGATSENPQFVLSWK